MFRKFTSTALTLALLPALISASPAVGEKEETRHDIILSHYQAPVVHRITTETGSFLIDSISYENRDCGVTTGVVIDIKNAYEYVDTTGRCGDITIKASFDNFNCVGLDCQRKFNN